MVVPRGAPSPASQELRDLSRKCGRGVRAITERQTGSRPMHYVFQFGVVLDNLPLLLHGALLTIRLSALAMLFGLGVGILGAAVATSGPGWGRLLVRGYVEIIRNTPFLVQLFIIYFSLPAIGLRMRADEAALLGMT